MSEVQQQVNKVKSYTERFREMEEQLESLTILWADANQAFSTAASMIKDISSQVRLCADQLSAIYSLSERGDKLTRENVQREINESRSTQVRLILDNDEKAGLIKKIDSVINGDSIVVYNSKDVNIAFKAAAAFEGDGVKLGDLLGKKSGDTVSDMTIESVYEIVQRSQEIPSEETSQ